MSFTAAERQFAHRAGRSAPMNKRHQNASVSNTLDAGEFQVLRSSLPTIAGAALVTNTGYWVYVGRCARPVTAAFVKFWMSTAAAGTQVGEVAIATSPAAPNGAAQTLTVVAVNGTLTDLTIANATKANTVSVAYAPNPTDHLWLGIRTAMSVTQPTVFGHTFDCSNGEILSTATPGVLALGTSYTGALITETIAWQGPALFLTLA